MAEHSVKLSAENRNANYEKNIRCVIQIDFFLRTFPSVAVRTNASRYVSSFAFVPKQKPVKTDVTRKHGDRSSPWKRENKKGDHRGNGPDHPDV